MFTVDCEVPIGVRERVYFGPRLHNAVFCLKNNEEENAASWMWLDEAEIDDGFKPVKGTLRLIDGRIYYVDARDVAESIKLNNGGGI